MATKISRNKHVIDAAGKAPGRLATEISKLLMGKHKPDFTPNLDGGDIVEVSNAAQMKFSGRKIETKVYYKHTGYLGHLKERKASEVMAEDPTKILYHAVSRMLPKNRHRNTRLKRLTIKK